MNTERNCQSCKYYKDGYCENLELKPCYPQKGCDEFVKSGLTDIYNRADVIAILIELQQEIEEDVLADDPDTLIPFLQARETCVAIIQQKINAFKMQEKSEE